MSRLRVSQGPNDICRWPRRRDVPGHFGAFDDIGHEGYFGAEM